MSKDVDFNLAKVPLETINVAVSLLSRKESGQTEEGTRVSLAEKMEATENEDERKYIRYILDLDKETSKSGPT